MYSVGDHPEVTARDAGNGRGPDGKQVFRVWSDGQGSYGLGTGREMSLAAFRDVVFEGDRGACLAFVSQRLAPQPAVPGHRHEPVPQAIAA